MHTTDDIRSNQLTIWCGAILLLAVVCLSAWAFMPPAKSEMLVIQGRLERASEVWFGRKHQTRAFALRIAIDGGTPETVCLHEASIYDRDRKVYDIAKIEALIGKAVTVYRPPEKWSITTLYEKRVLALATGSDTVLSYEAVTRRARLTLWWLGSMLVFIALSILGWNSFLGAAAAGRRPRRIEAAD